jgi:phospholipase C
MATSSATEPQVGSVTLIGHPQVQSISVGDDGSVWAVDMQGRVLMSTENVQAWLGGQGQATYVSVDVSQNLALAVTGDASVSTLALTGGSWNPMDSVPVAPGVKVKAVASGYDSRRQRNAVYALDSNGAIWQYGLIDQDPWWKGTLTASAIAATYEGLYGLVGGVLKVASDALGTWSAITMPSENAASFAVGAQGFFWLVGLSGQIYQYVGATMPSAPSQWTKVTNLPNGLAAAQIACGEDTTTWALSGTGAVYAFDAKTEAWDAISVSTGVQVAQMSVSTREQAFAVDTNGNLWRYTEHLPQFSVVTMPSAWPSVAPLVAEDADNLYGLDWSSLLWTAQNTGATWKITSHSNTQFMWISATSGEIWAVDVNGIAFEQIDSTWTPQMAGVGDALFQRLAVAPASTGNPNGVVAALDKDGGPWQWDAQNSQWSELAHVIDDSFVSIAVLPEGVIMAVGASGSIYMLLGSHWIIGGGDNLVAEIAAGGDDDVWAIDMDGYAVEVGSALDLLEVGPLAAAGHSRLSKPLWDAQNPFDETHSTHLWIVNRGAYLANAQGALGQKVAGFVNPFTGQHDPKGFHEGVCQGLYDADFLPAYNGVGKWGLPLYDGHFYNPDTGKNYLGGKSHTALTQGALRFNNAVTKWKTNKTATNYDAGYQLGLSLHYLTDLTQPMHAANYTVASSFPWGYHTDFESYVMEIQGTVAAPTAYVPSQLGAVPDPYLIHAARNSKNKYYIKVAPALDPYTGFTSYYRGLADAAVNGMLTDAIKITSQYLVAWMQAAG